MTYARRRDENEVSLVALARQLGAPWLMFGPLDGWTCVRGLWFPIEIKRPEREGKADEYTPAQLRFLALAKAHHGRVLVWRSREDVIKFLGGRVAA